MTVRNIRAHQSRGLLPPPEVRARTGLLRARAHRAAAADPRDAGGGLQPQGDRAPRRAHRGRRRARCSASRRAVLSPFADEEPEFPTARGAARSGSAAAVDPKLIARAERLGLIRAARRRSLRGAEPDAHARRRGGRRARRSARATRSRSCEQIQRSSRAIADAFVRLFLRGRAGGGSTRPARPPEQWARLPRALERLRPLASEARARRLPAGHDARGGEGVRRGDRQALLGARLTYGTAFVRATLASSRTLRSRGMRRSVRRSYA